MIEVDGLLINHMQKTTHPPPTLTKTQPQNPAKWIDYNSKPFPE